MVLTYIHSQLASIDYNPRHLSTYVAVLTPGLSFLVQRIQLAPFISWIKQDVRVRLNQLEKMDDTQLATFNNQARKVHKICEWHMLGAAMQLITSMAITVLAHTWIGLGVALAAFYQYHQTRQYFVFTYERTPSGDPVTHLLTGSWPVVNTVLQLG